MPRRRLREKTLPPLHPNAGLAAQYQRRVDALLTEMHRSLLRWLAAQWRRNPPTLAEDDLPSTDLADEIARLGRRWQSRFDDLAPSLAEYFATAAQRRVAGRLQEILDKGGMTVNFRMSRPTRDAMRAIIEENVGLIRSIGQEHIAAVKGHVMRSVSLGRDLADLTRSLEDQFGVSRRRAELIARDQNNKATAAFQRIRQTEAGITRARWIHSGAGKHPREEHVAFAAGKLGGPFYDVDKGAFLEGEWVWPGTAIGCRCISKPVIVGFS